MASYGLKYSAECGDLANAFQTGANNYKWTLEIYEKAYAGASSTIELKSLTLAYQPENTNEKYPLVIPSVLEASVHIDTNYDLRELFSTDETKYQVRLLKDTDIYWVGYLITDLYEEDYYDAPYTLVLRAGDGLYRGADKRLIPTIYGTNYIPNGLNANERVIGNNIDLLTLLTGCLAQLRGTIEDDQYITEAFNIYGDSFDKTDSDSSLEQTFVNIARFVQRRESSGMAPRMWPIMDILSEICKITNCYLFQDYDAQENRVSWFLINPDEYLMNIGGIRKISRRTFTFYSSITYNNYYEENLELTVSTSKVDRNNPDNLFQIYRNRQYSAVPSYAEYNFRFIPGDGAYKNLIYIYDFTDIRSWSYNQANSRYELRGWSLANGLDYKQDYTSVAFINSRGFQMIDTETGYLEQTIGVDNGIELGFSVLADIVADRARAGSIAGIVRARFANEVRFTVRIDAGATDYWLKFEDVYGGRLTKTISPPDNNDDLFYDTTEITVARDDDNFIRVVPAGVGPDSYQFYPDEDAVYQIIINELTVQQSTVGSASTEYSIDLYDNTGSKVKTLITFPIYPAGGSGGANRLTFVYANGNSKVTFAELDSSKSYYLVLENNNAGTQQAYYSFDFEIGRTAFLWQSSFVNCQIPLAYITKDVNDHDPFVFTTTTPVAGDMRVRLKASDEVIYKGNGQTYLFPSITNWKLFQIDGSEGGLRGANVVVRNKEIDGSNVSVKRWEREYQIGQSVTDSLGSLRYSNGQTIQQWDEKIDGVILNRNANLFDVLGNQVVNNYAETNVAITSPYWVGNRLLHFYNCLLLSDNSETLKLGIREMTYNILENEATVRALKLNRSNTTIITIDDEKPSITAPREDVIGEYPPFSGTDQEYFQRGEGGIEPPEIIDYKDANVIDTGSVVQGVDGYIMTPFGSVEAYSQSEYSLSSDLSVSDVTETDIGWDENGAFEQEEYIVEDGANPEQINFTKNGTYVIQLTLVISAGAANGRYTVRFKSSTDTVILIQQTITSDATQDTVINSSKEIPIDIDETYKITIDQNSGGSMTVKDTSTIFIKRSSIG